MVRVQDVPVDSRPEGAMGFGQKRACEHRDIYGHDQAAQFPLHRQLFMRSFPRFCEGLAFREAPETQPTMTYPPA